MTTRSITRALLYGMAAALALASAGSHQAKADGIITPNPGLPPTGAIGGQAGYLNVGPPVVYDNVPIDNSGVNVTIALSHIDHGVFTGINVTTSGPNETESFNSTLTGLASVVGGPQDVPFTLNGPVSVEAFGKAGMTTGTFATQMLSMDMTGNVLGLPAEVTLTTTPTTGSTTITDIGGGYFHITSFFDVFTELSLDAGPFIPQTSGGNGNGSEHVVLQTVPEPSALVLGAIATTVGLAYAGSRRRRAT
jgi:hypothetical protein